VAVSDFRAGDHGLLSCLGSLVVHQDKTIVSGQQDVRNVLILLCPMSDDLFCFGVIIALQNLQQENTHDVQGLLVMMNEMLSVMLIVGILHPSGTSD
jgi:hypothetical protein